MAARGSGGSRRVALAAAAPRSPRRPAAPPTSRGARTEPRRDDGVGRGHQRRSTPSTTAISSTSTSASASSTRRRARRSGARRASRRPGLSTGGYTSNLLNVASYSETTSKLIPRLDVGLYKDLALYLRLPIILNNTRELTGLDGSAEAAGVALAGAPGEPLFPLPFTSPNRSGIEYLAVGLDVNIMNQARDRTKPTWLFGIEGRFPVERADARLHRDAEERPGEVRRSDGRQPEQQQRRRVRGGADRPARDPGVSRGTIGLEVHTFLSKRIKYVEPYGGFKALFEFQQESSDYGLTDLKTSLVNHPPLVGTVMLGADDHPLGEPREVHRAHARSALHRRVPLRGARLLGAVRRARLERRELAAPAAVGGVPRRTTRTTPTVCRTGDREGLLAVDRRRGLAADVLHGAQRRPAVRLVPRLGERDVEGGRASWKFQIGAGFRHDQGHGIGGDQPCNSQYKDSLGAAGPCRRQDADGRLTVTGSPNPNYRPTINAVGRRFYVNDSNTFDLFASGTFMF